MKELIKNQISDEIFSKIEELEKERNQEKQKVIAQVIINELNIEDFTPYMAYDNEGDIFIALNYYFSSNEITNSILNQNHDVSITSDGVYIDDENFLEQFKEDYHQKIVSDRDEEKEKVKISNQKQRKYNEISEKLEFLNNQLMNLINFQRPKCVGNYTKISEIDKEIENLEKIIKKYERELNTKEEFVDFVNRTGKNIGEIQNTKLAEFIGVSEGAIRLMKTNDIHRLDCVYLGALCKANKIKKEDLIKLVEDR